MAVNKINRLERLEVMKSAVRFKNLRIRWWFGVVQPLPPLKNFQRFLFSQSLLVSIIWSSFQGFFDFQKVGGAGGGKFYA